MTEFIGPWVEKWRPKTIEDAILPEDTKNFLKNMAKSPDSMPNLLFIGSAGVGKTTAAKAMMEEIDADYIIINASLHGNIDTLRNEIHDFASKVSFSGNRKFVILDEMDYLNKQSTQPALRNFTEEFSRNCCFIGTCNFKGNIIDPLISRFTVKEFSIPKSEKKDLLIKSTKRIFMILENEKVSYDKKAVVSHINRYFPDLRKTLNELQGYAKQRGEIDLGILSSGIVEGFDELIKILKERDFPELIKWSQRYDDFAISDLNAKLFAKAETEFGTKNLPQMILTMNEADYKDKFVSNKQLNILSMLTTIMKDLIK